jgi:Ulp1 family protease
LNYEKIFVAFLYNSHFYLGIIDLINQRISIMDSLNSLNFCFIGLKKLKNILAVLAELDTRIIVDNFEWCIPQNVPQQPNGFDCGIYVVDFIEYLIIKDFSIFNYSSEYKRFKMNKLLEENVAYNHIAYTSDSQLYIDKLDQFDSFDNDFRETRRNIINRNIDFLNL